MIVAIVGASEDIVSKLCQKQLDVFFLPRGSNNCQELKALNPEVLICRNRDNIAQFVDDCPNLRFIFILEVGLERLPFATLQAHKIRVANTSGISADVMSNYAMACILNHAARLSENLLNQQNHFWKKYQCTDGLSGKTLLIVGAGRTGKMIAEKARVFGMRALGVVHSARPIVFFDEIGTLDDLDVFLSQADYVICVLPLTPETNHIFSQRRFAQMKPKAVFINMSRGALIDEEDLLSAVDAHQIAKAYLDVFEEEPLPYDHAFWRHGDIMISPHQSGRLEDYMDRALEMFLQNYRAYQSGAVMPNEVNLERGY